MRGRYTRRRLDISYENEWYNKEHLPASVRCPAPRALTATAAPAPPAGEIDKPRRLSASEMRTRPQAGCSIAGATTATPSILREAGPKWLEQGAPPARYSAATRFHKDRMAWRS